MIRELIRIFGRPKPNHKLEKTSHLWAILEDFSTYKPTISTENAVNIRGTISIHFAADDERARKVVRRSNYRMTGKHPSPLNGRMIHWESQYEKEAFQLMEASPFVSAYREQPAIFKYHNGDDVILTHFPDILVTLTNGVQVFVEVKPDRAKSDQQLLDREKLIKQLLVTLGYGYIQIYPNQLEDFQYLKNAQYMLWQTKAPTPYSIKLLVQKFMNKKKKIKLGLLINHLNSLNARSWVFFLIMEGYITCDLSEKLVSSTFIMLNNKLGGVI